MDQTELIASLKNGLLGWMDFHDLKVAYTDIRNNYPFTNGNMYDVIISVEDIEKVEDPVAFLMECKKHLKSKSRLYIGVNNRFGLRYFCGDKDPYTKRNFDGIEGYCRAYKRKEDVFEGRCYSKAELVTILEEAEIKTYKFYSVFSSLDNPTLVYADDFLPTEDLSGRIFPIYNSPETVFLDEKILMKGIIENGMFHQMAEAYLIECAFDVELSNVLQVTASLERGEKDALYTIIHSNKIVEKKPVYPEGHARVKVLYDNGKMLAQRGLAIVPSEIKNDTLLMPYMDWQIGQVYLKSLLKKDINLFLEKMDLFRDLILSSSEIEIPDLGDGMGATLMKGYLDMVPLNSFYSNGTFSFFDQEFVVEHFPANVIIWRMVATFYSGDLEAQRFYPMDLLLERYGLKKCRDKWQKMEFEFLRKLRSEDVLLEYHNKVRADNNIINSNRQRLNYSAEDYQRVFVDIFDRAETRELYLFGSGNFARKFIALYGKDYNISAILDNQKEKWGQTLEGITIQPPNILSQLQSGEYKVIICIKDYVSVVKQLEKMQIYDYAIYDWNKSYPRKENDIISTEVKQEKKKYHIGYVSGAFDMFHKGHLNLLRKAKEQCEYLIVGVISDSNIRQLKNKNPMIPQEDRVDIVRSCKYVDRAEVLPEKFEGIRDAYKMFHFDVQFSGDDHKEDSTWNVDKEYLKRNGADIVYFSYTEGISSTKIRELIKEKS